ncbi:MAG: ATP-binding protein [Deltaproteobacteria bacterium]|nr:ATP-binding protein [Deltaproteobacteria bacterium]
MKLRLKLVLAQAPLAIALIVVGTVSAFVTLRLGDNTRLILADNYRSVLAVQRMKEAIERLGGLSLVKLTRRAHLHVTQPSDHRAAFERELVVEEGNITEPGEGLAVAQVRAAWTEFTNDLQTFDALADPDARDVHYLKRLAPKLELIKRLCDDILAVNQDAMVRKSSRAEQSAERFEQLVVLVVLSALILGLMASAWLTTRSLRPLGVVTAAVRRFGQGDLKARADVVGNDEIVVLAKEFNSMADRLAQYRASSLGELLAAQHAAQAAIDGLPDPVVILDQQGRPQVVNQAAVQLLSLSNEGGDAGLLADVDPRVQAVVDRLRVHVFSGKGAYIPRGFEDAIRVAKTTDGERIFLPRGSPIYGDTGSIVGAAIVLQDATRLFRFDELKNNVVATVAHEFRTPLTSLRMSLHLCTEETVGPLTPNQADLLFAAREDCERLQTIVDDLLNLARLESGHIDLQRRNIEPEGLVSMALDVHRSAAEHANVKLAAEIPPGLPEVFVDVDRIALVFTNILSNAIRYSPAGSSVIVRVSAEQPEVPFEDHRSKPPTCVMFEIIDAGPGIPVAHQAGLFEKFYRVPGSPEGGSGLGLFIAKGIVQAHGGSIGVRSQPAEGTCFWFKVPTATV